MIKSTPKYFIGISRFNKSIDNKNSIEKSSLLLLDKEFRLLDREDIPTICNAVATSDSIIFCYDSDNREFYRVTSVNQKLTISSILKLEAYESVTIKDNYIVGQRKIDGSICIFSLDTVDSRCIDKPQVDRSLIETVYNNAVDSAKSANFKVMSYEPKLNITFGHIADWQNGGGLFTIYKEDRWFNLSYLNIDYHLVPSYSKWVPNEEGTKLLTLSRYDNIVRVIEIDLNRMSVSELYKFDISGKTIMYSSNNVVVVEDAMYFFDLNREFKHINIDICNDKIYRSNFNNSTYFLSSGCRELIEITNDGIVNRMNINLDLEGEQIPEFFYIESNELVNTDIVESK